MLVERGPRVHAVSDLPPTGWAALRHQTQQLFTCRLAPLSLKAVEESKAQSPKSRA